MLRSFSGLAFAFAALLCTAAGLAEEPRSENADPESFRFSVEIDAPGPIAALLKQGLDLVRWAADSRVSMPLLERLVVEARTAARDALAAEGYFSATVSSQVERAPPVRVRIQVEPGPRTVVAGVDLRFRGAVASGGPAAAERLAAVKRGWLLKNGEPFRQTQWDAAKRKALAELGAGRYAAARIAASAARVDPGANTAHLEVEFDSGPEYRAGGMRVAGLSRYPQSVVENMSPFAPGEPYDEIKMQIFLRRLLESGYFASARTEIDTRAPPQSAPLDVVVIEARSQRIDTGIAFSTDTKLGLQTDYSNANIFDSAWRFRSRLKLDAKNQLLDGNFDTPPQPGGTWNTYSAKIERTDIQNQVTRQASIGAAHNWGLERTPSQLSLSAHTERKRIEASDIEDSHAVFLGYRKTFRHTDDLLAPRRGVLGSVQLGTSVPGLATQDFLRGTIRATAFVPAGERADVTFRVHGGVVIADSRFGIPSTFLFRTGGDQTVRGYAFESIGVPQGNAIVGGRYLATASVEYTRWFAGDWGGAVFVDAGDAFDSRHAFDLAVGYGIGARWRSPIGPFRADIAYGERARSLRLHFSAGFTF
ncbi:MAG: autotransporter assembly complex protein TamA [Betaproteobacteria bacterium]